MVLCCSSCRASGIEDNQEAASTNSERDEQTEHGTTAKVIAVPCRELTLASSAWLDLQITEPNTCMALEITDPVASELMNVVEMMKAAPALGTGEHLATVSSIEPHAALLTTPPTSCNSVDASESYFQIEVPGTYDSTCEHVLKLQQGESSLANKGAPDNILVHGEDAGPGIPAMPIEADTTIHDDNAEEATETSAALEFEVVAALSAHAEVDIDTVRKRFISYVCFTVLR